MREAEDEFVRALQRMVADAAAEAAVLDRTRTRGLRRVAEEEATLAGTFVDLAERRATVSVRTSAARAHRGTVAAVGRDFAVVRDGDAAPVFVPFAAVASVRLLEGGAGDPAGGRTGAVTSTLAALLTGLAAERPRVQVVTQAEEALAGTLRAAGADVCTLRLDGAPPVTAHIPVGAIAELTLYDL